MPVHDDLGIRMKTFYEQIPKTRLMRRCPVAIRIDGKAFHTFTRGFDRPFDQVLIESMQQTTKYLCENIQGCVLGYTQSDEITLILVDYKNLNSDAWFDYEVQKMCSIAASMATMAFNRSFARAFDAWGKAHCPDWDLGGTFEPIDEKIDKLCSAYNCAKQRGAMFDARVFNIPKEEVANLIYWRQIDASRNSVQMVGQANFSHRELHGKSCSDIQDMLMNEKGINWNDFPTHQKRGSCCVKMPFTVNANTSSESIRNKWFIDLGIPIFKGENRKYIDDLIFVGE